MPYLPLIALNDPNAPVTPPPKTQKQTGIVFDTRLFLSSAWWPLFGGCCVVFALDLLVELRKYGEVVWQNP